MEDEIEDLVGDVQNTDSQKSVATSNMYSMDFTDSGSDKHNSSSKETYVIERDESGDSVGSFVLNEKPSFINVNDHALDNHDMTMQEADRISKTTSACFNRCSIAQEIFTQTSKTIVQLAETEGVVKKIESNSLETQTSFISISKDKSLEYKIQVSGTHHSFSKNLFSLGNGDNLNYNFTRCNQVMATSIDDGSSKFPLSDSENLGTKSDSSKDDRIIKVIQDEYSMLTTTAGKDGTLDQELFEESSTSDADMEEDSLQCNEYGQNKNYYGDTTSDTSEISKSIDNDIEDLYKKLSEKINLKEDIAYDQEPTRLGTLTPLAEESSSKSIIDIKPECNNLEDDQDKYFLFQNAGIKVKVLPDQKFRRNVEDFKLPPIKVNEPCPLSPRLNFLFSVNHQQPIEGNIIEENKEFGTKDSVVRQKAHFDSHNDSRRTSNTVQLPPIHADKIHKARLFKNGINDIKNYNNNPKGNIEVSPRESINIKDKIMELKMSNTNYKHRPKTRRTECKTSRSGSPGSGSPGESRLGDIAERGSDVLCLELLQRLRSSAWLEVCDTLEEVPRVMEKYWGIVSENRIADLIRQVSNHLESPRTQVAKTACSTLASILKSTNYTKKPEFYEAMSTLLIKTGSFNRLVRRAANVALDGVVCSVELTHAVTALCIHGTSHKSPLVRCAAARLLVVGCALAGGGRELLRTRPPSAVSARRYALTALSTLLEDKTLDTRKFAERLYSMLRPLPNFEAFYLTDVDIGVASRQMKKYDQMLHCCPSKETS